MCPVFSENDLFHQKDFNKVDYQTKILTNPTKFDPQLGLFRNLNLYHSDMQMDASYKLQY